MGNVPDRINKAIQEFLQGVNKMFGDRAKKIILYGSYARGDFDNSSDIDIMILTDFSDEEIVEYGEKIWDFTYDIELENNVLISPLIKNIDKFKNINDRDLLLKNIKVEDLILTIDLDTLNMEG